MASTTQPGTAPIKSQYLIDLRAAPASVDDDAAEGSTSHVKRPAADRDDEAAEADGPAAKKIKLSAAQRRKLSKEEKKQQRGSNKGRRWGKMHDELDLCWKIASGGTCEFGTECRHNHDVSAYLAAKPRDIYFPTLEELSEVPPFVTKPADDPDAVHPARPSVDPRTRCPIIEETGECRHALKCRFLGGHDRKSTEDTAMKSAEEAEKQTLVSNAEVNFMSGPVLKLLRTKKYPTPVTDVYVRELQQQAKEDEAKEEARREAKKASESAGEPKPAVIIAESEQSPAENGTVTAPEAAKPSAEEIEAQADTPDVPIRLPEKKRLNWSGKTYLAPLTTVGNLPFRRLCVGYGADITCGEMGLANSFLSGSKEEWSLVRRHPDEKTFGIQIAGSKPASLVSCAEVIAKECGDGVDFVDLNCGCPIDLVFRTGSGSALLDAPGRLSKILTGMNRALGAIPLTVKLRTGVKEGKNTAHKLMPRLSAERSISAMTLHGRTRQQRYAKLADWDYIKECVEAVRAREAEEDLPRVPIFGGGDCFSSQDYWSAIDKSGVDGVMVARGALIKPWIFTEIKEHREWDISSRERLEGIRKYAEFGLNHFGSDTAGVNTTRRYLCEALSFQYRYVPIGLLETLPGRINDRAPLFRGRDELETLLASSDSRDWVKISEMFLGPAPEAWTFTPKHKSNAYGNEEGQG
ncbi:FMN-linked oxidoreductase [Dentipellis sp. KUC8613]|nr:FMN-linked oxidoreductase [Dentipellis sp. KUC8613]